MCPETPEIGSLGLPIGESDSRYTGFPVIVGAKFAVLFPHVSRTPCLELKQRRICGLPLSEQDPSRVHVGSCHRPETSRQARAEGRRGVFSAKVVFGGGHRLFSGFEG